MCIKNMKWSVNFKVNISGAVVCVEQLRLGGSNNKTVSRNFFFFFLQKLEVFVVTEKEAKQEIVLLMDDFSSLSEGVQQPTKKLRD